MSKTFDSLDDIFDVDEDKKNLPVKANDPTPQEVDSELSRSTIRDLIDKGQDALDGALDLAKNSEAPRAYEVTAQLLKAVGDLAKDLLEIEKRKQELEKPAEPNKQLPSIGTQNNLIFTGSTHDLMKVLKQQARETGKLLPEENLVQEAEIIEED